MRALRPVRVLVEHLAAGLLMRGVCQLIMHYHLIGICGTAMAWPSWNGVGARAVVTRSAKHVYSPMATMLASLGITVRQGKEI